MAVCRYDPRYLYENRGGIADTHGAHSGSDAGSFAGCVAEWQTPEILHSDQGSEYSARRYRKYAEAFGIRLSMSGKSSPWENGYQESFYSQFKIDLGDPNRFETLGELIAEIYRLIFVYNNFRIHSKLKMPPAIFAERQQELLKGRTPP